jgi:hypothetical protein
MALTSPGVEVTIIDESQYIPAATNSVPYVLLATASNKISGAGVGVATGTLAATANRVNLITSQRDLLATYGNPFFYKTTAGTPINGYELNEYGLLAAYSALGVSNRCYVQRVDIDLAELTASLVRPTGAPDNGTYWLDTANSTWGIFEWNQVTSAFTNKVPLVITDASQVTFSDPHYYPLPSIGSIGDYAIVTYVPEGTIPFNDMYYKRGGPTDAQAPSWSQDGLTADELYNSWVLVGSDQWKTSWPAIAATNAPALTIGNAITINGTTITFTGTTTLSLVQQINEAGISGVYAASFGGRLNIYADNTASPDGSTINGGLVAISNAVGTPLTAIGITPGTYSAPALYEAPSYQVPRWRTYDADPEPTGSVWLKINNVNLGANLVVKKYNATLGTFVQQACPVYTGETPANYALDPSGGGQNIPAGSTYAFVSASENGIDQKTGGYQILERYASGPTIITGSVANPTGFSSGSSFNIRATQPGTLTNQQGDAVLTGTTAADFVAAVSAANVPYVSASINSAGNIVFTHSAGGTIFLFPLIGDPVSIAGFNPSVLGVREANELDTYLILSNWVTDPWFTYTAASTAPDQDPVNGRLWYYSATDQVDIMIQQNGSWLGYRNVNNDVRGNNLTITDPNGPIFSPTEPLTQSDGTQLEYGDLWIDTSDLENYPVISRWQLGDGTDEWIRIDNTDQTTENGILFADARWAPNGSTDPISDPFPTIQSLLTSNYLDLDAPPTTLYPQGMLLFNTRRSGFNVKRFAVNYFSTQNFPGETLPAVKNTWITASGNKNNGSPYMGRQAQRALVVQALKSGIDTSQTAREEQKTFNLIACPQYPELLPNMIALNNERNNTAFVISDTPLRLAPEDINAWATNADGEGLPTSEGLVAGDVYSGTFYPSCQTVDLSGSPVVQPPSHMMIRTFIRNDEVAFPWLAPAGTRRGVVDNAQQIGYINGATGEFETLGVRQGLRDELYLNRINPITFVPGVGITNFGNKTLTSLTSALDRINVARLIAFIRGRLEIIGKQFLFEPNDQITRNEITNAIDSLMIDLVAKRGIYDYLIVCDLTNNTPARIDRNELYVDVAIEPVKAVEFIYIPLRIRNTGEIAGLASGTQSGSAG